MSESSVASPPGIDVPRVTEWVVANVPGAEPPLSFTKVGHGRSNLTFRMEDAGGRRWVLRRPPLGPLLPSAHDMAREHRVLSALSTGDLPVPGTLGLCTDPEVSGAPFYVMEHAEGHVLASSADAEPISREARRTAGLELGRVLARLHAVDVDAVGLGDLGRREGYAQRQLKRWSRQWEASKTKEIPAVEDVARRLEAAVPEQTSVGIVHGDYRLDNAIIDDTGTIKAILDWELCTLGDPLADLGMLMVYYSEPGDDLAPLGDAPTHAPGFPSREEVVAAYVEESGGADVSALDFWRVLGYWRITVILMGVYRRWLENPINSGPGVEALAPRIDDLAALAARTADEAGL